MAKLSLILFLLISISILNTPSTSHPNHAHLRPSRTLAFINSSCRDTRFPTLCVQCLVDYARVANVTIQTPQEITFASLLVSLRRATTTRKFLLKVAKSNQGIEDCLDQINLSIEELYTSIKEVRQLVRATSVSRHGDDERDMVISWHISNVETMLGSALSDATNCVDEFQGKRMSKLKATVKVKVLNVAEVTSIALALFHRFASKYGN